MGKFGHKILETFLVRRRKYFDIMNRLSMNHQCVGQTDRLADSICRYTLHRQKFNAKFCKHLLKYQQKSHGVLLILTLYDTKITCKIKGHQNRNAFRLTVMSYFY